MELVQIYFTNFKLSLLIIIIISLHFSVFFILKFFLLDLDPGGKMNADPCGAGSTALLCCFRLQNVWCTLFRIRMTEITDSGYLTWRPESSCCARDMVLGAMDRFRIR